MCLLESNIISMYVDCYTSYNVYILIPISVIFPDTWQAEVSPVK